MKAAQKAESDQALQKQLAARKTKRLYVQPTPCAHTHSLSFSKAKRLYVQPTPSQAPVCSTNLLFEHTPALTLHTCTLQLCGINGMNLFGSNP